MDRGRDSPLEAQGNVAPDDGSCVSSLSDGICDTDANIINRYSSRLTDVNTPKQNTTTTTDREAIDLLELSIGSVSPRTDGDNRTSSNRVPREITIASGLPHFPNLTFRTRSGLERKPNYEKWKQEFDYHEGKHIWVKNGNKGVQHQAKLKRKPYQRNLFLHGAQCKDECFCKEPVLDIEWTDLRKVQQTVVISECSIETTQRNTDRERKQQTILPTHICQQVRQDVERFTSENAYPVQGTIGCALFCVLLLIDMSGSGDVDWGNTITSVLELNDKYICSTKVRFLIGTKWDRPDVLRKFCGLLDMRMVEKYMRTNYNESYRFMSQTDTTLPIHRIIVDEPNGFSIAQCVMQRFHKLPPIAKAKMEEREIWYCSPPPGDDSADCANDEKDNEYGHCVLIDHKNKQFYCCFQENERIYKPTNRSQLCPRKINWLDLSVCIGQTSPWSYVKKFVRIWTLQKSPIARKERYHLPAQLKANIEDHPYLTTVTVSLDCERPNKRVQNLINAPKSFNNENEDIPEEEGWVCRWKDGYGIKKEDLKDYWEKYAGGKDKEFPCAYDTNKKHRLKENIYQHAKRALQCEFYEIKIKGDGDCGFSALFRAFISDPDYHFEMIKKDKPLSVMELKKKIVGMIMKNDNDDEEARKELQSVWGYFAKEKDTKNNTDYSLLLEALDKSKDGKYRKGLLKNVIYAKGMWLDEAIAMFIEKIYNIRILLVRSYHKKRVVTLAGDEKFWPYTALTSTVPNAVKDNTHYVILHNNRGNHFNLFISKFYKKAIFSRDEMKESPTVSSLFQRELEGGDGKSESHDEVDI